MAESSDDIPQQLLTCDEVYVYKIPLLTSANQDHRAENWDLANPLATTNLKVVGSSARVQLEFRRESTVFCVSEIFKFSDLLFVADSSRYFVVPISKNGRTIWIGFGFRDRDRALDLREAIQHWEKAKNRPKLKEYSIPKLEKNQKLHIGEDGTSTIVQVEDKPKPVPKLLKKPPSSSLAAPTTSPTPAPSTTTTTTTEDAVDDDDWENDFVSA